FLFLFLLRRPPRPPLFPYTTLFRSGPAAENGPMVPADLQPDLRFAGKWLVGNVNAGTQSRAGIVNLCLRQIERIFALDAPGTHVIPDRISFNAAGRRNK